MSARHKVTHKPCPVCNGIYDHMANPNNGTLANEESLTVDDWRRIWWFIKFVQLPFLHQVVTEARGRAK